MMRDGARGPDLLCIVLYMYLSYNTMAYGPQPLVNIPKNFVSNRVRSTQAVPYSSFVNFMKLDLELIKQWGMESCM